MKEIRLLKADEIEVKIKQVGEKGTVLLLYKTARVDMAILDETFGADNWECDYKTVNDNLYCGIGVDCDGKKVWKWDCGVESREDGEGNEKKGEASDAFKRAGFRWGIGRELYTSPFIFLSLPTKQKNYGSWELVDKSARFKVLDIEYSDRTIKSLTICDSKGTVVYPSYQMKKTQAKEVNVAVSEELIYEAKALNIPLDKVERKYGELTDEVLRTSIKMRKEYLANENKG